MEMNHPFLRWLRRVLANFCAFMLFPLTLSAAYLLDQAYQVVRDFRVITQVVTPEGVLIEGTMDKVRPCRFVVSIRARHCWRAMLGQIAQRINANLFQSAPAIAGGRCPVRCGLRCCGWCFNPRPPLLAGDACA